jgi:hypothetical protein
VTSGKSQGLTRPTRPNVNRPNSESIRFGPDLSQQAHPIFWGLLALVVVGGVVGTFLALGALTASRVLGFGGGDSGSGPTAGSSMYLPEPQATDSSPSAAPSSGDGSAPSTPSSSATSKPSKPANPIKLVASPLAVSSFGRINLTGTYPGGDGAILQVQRKDGGKWLEFSVTAAVNGESFATYVQTSRTGENRFRMMDTDTKKVSNPVTVTVG